MFKKATVVILSTNQRSTIVKEETGINKYKLHLDNGRKGNWNYQHLYILSDDEIKEGDWVIFQNQITQCRAVNGFGKPIVDRNTVLNTGDERYNGKKIIATTDTSLKFGEDVPGIIRYKSLPQPSQQFIEKFINEYNKGNVITDVMVEHESYCTYGDNCPSKGDYLKQHLCNVDYRLKINSKDNTITIKKVKDSWSRGEVISLILDAYYRGTNDGCDDSQVWHKETIDEWIETNL